jgi:carboxylesterase type B
MSGAVIGRDGELELVQEFLDAIGSGPTGLVLAGEAAIGKTILWQAAVEHARGRFARVLTCRGTEANGPTS